MPDLRTLIAKHEVFAAYLQSNLTKPDRSHHPILVLGQVCVPGFIHRKSIKRMRAMNRQSDNPIIAAESIVSRAGGRNTAQIAGTIPA
jgi:hypothetical protein